MYHPNPRLSPAFPPFSDFPSLLRHLRYAPVVPGGFPYRMVFALGRLAARVGVLAPDTRVECIERESWLLVLTPLAGSSSIRAAVSDIRRLDLRAPSETRGKRVLILDRPYGARMRSFYNKKVRNPTNVAKALLLAGCAPLAHTTTPEAFVEYVRNIVGRSDKDKHLYTFGQICTACGRRPSEVERVDVRRDRVRLEGLLGVDLGRVVNSSEAVATHAEPMELPPGAFDDVDEVDR